MGPPSFSESSFWQRLVEKKRAADKALKDKKPPMEIRGSSPTTNMSELTFEEIESATRGRSTDRHMNPDATPFHSRTTLPGHADMPGLFTPRETVLNPKAFQTAIKSRCDASNQISSHYKSDRKADAESDDKEPHNQVHFIESARKSDDIKSTNQIRVHNHGNFKTMRDADADLDTAKANNQVRLANDLSDEKVVDLVLKFWEKGELVPYALLAKYNLIQARRNGYNAPPSMAQPATVPVPPSMANSSCACVIM